MNEFLTTIGIARAVDLKMLTGTRIDLEQRRSRTRGTLWMAIALDALAVSTLGLEDEYLPFLFKNTRDPWSEGWATLIHHFVKPEIFPNWFMLNLDAQLGSHKRNDTIIVEKAKELGVPVVTRDRGVVQKAVARGVAAMSPESFAAPVMTLAEARKRFFERYNSRSIGWVLDTVGSYLDREAIKNQCETLRRWRIRYEYVWSDEPERYYLDTRRGELDL
jgi:hypothetical protein